MARWLRRLFTLMMLWLAAWIPADAAGFNFFDSSRPDSIPRTLSGTGMYQDLPAKRVSGDVIPFDVNAPLWTDGAAKQRFIAVPPGTSVVYDDTADTYAYPDRAMVIKNFSVDTIPGNPASRILFETRFTGLKKVAGIDKWYLFTYRWRLDQSDADLVPDSGQNATVRVWREGLGGALSLKKWRFPSRLQCAACHRVQATGGRTVLAFFTAQLNRPWEGDPFVNQLDHFFDIGLLQPKPGTARPNPANAPRWARWDDETASLDVRARSYIAANCSGCHGGRGIKTDAALGIKLDYDYHDMRVRTEMRGRPLVGGFPLDSAVLVAPGHPERSVLLFRQQMRNQKDLDFRPEFYAMPPLGSFEPDTNAIKVMTRWILEMPPVSAIGGGSGQGQTGSFRIRDGRMYLPRSLAGPSPRLALADLSGRPVRLTFLSEGVYRIEGRPVPGVHVLRVDGRVFRLFIL